MNAAKLNVGDFGDDVTRLHEALRHYGFTAPTEEIKRKFFGPGTREAVLACQRQHGWEVTGAVDATTAALLWGVTPTSHPSSIPDASPDLLGFPPSSRPPVPHPVSDVPKAATRAETDMHRVEVPGDVSIYTVVGTVVSSDCAEVGGLRVQIIDKNIRQDVLLVETRTDEHGGYSAHFSVPLLSERHKKQPDLQVRIFSGQAFLAASDIRYNATTFEVLHVLLPANLAMLPSGLRY